MKRMLQGIFSLFLLISVPFALNADVRNGNGCCPSVCSDSCGGCSDSCGGCSDSCGSCSDDCNPCCDKKGCFSHFVPRSQGSDTAFRLVGRQGQINLFDMGDYYLNASLGLKYSQSFKNGHIAEYLFGAESIRVTGSRVVGRNAGCDWLADYFCLPTDFESTVCFDPKIKNFMADFEFYMGLDNWYEGLFARLDIPVVWSRWSLEANESVKTKGVNGFDAGYMSCSEDGIDRSLLNDRWLTAMFGCGKACGDVKEGIKCGKLQCDSDSVTRVADLQFYFGWNFLRDEDYHAGLALLVKAPTGNSGEDCLLFPAIVGNGKHWELGGSLTSHYTFWTSCDEERSFAAYLDADITHLFKHEECRCFDLCGKPCSRYMLIEQLGTPVDQLFGTNDLTGPNGVTVASSAKAPANQYQGALFPLGNKTQTRANVSYAVQGDVTLKFAYVSCNWEFDLGYNFWGRSGEKVCIKNDPFCGKKYGIKGDAYVCAFGANDAPTQSLQGVAVNLSATQSGANIHTGLNFANFDGTEEAVIQDSRNPNIDNANFAMLSEAGQTQPAANGDDLVPNVGDNGSIDGANGRTTRTSIDPILLRQGDLDTRKGPSAMSSKLFGHINYTWADHECYVPYLGIGASGEWAHERHGARATYSQWAIEVKGGLTWE